ncbi:PREDICTED: heat shock 70 kDa protein 12A-like [Amphimedon queenslandica]|uniref:Uncharacterized protein n=1 Tax=Amphimedon queenslandica TaxID=400682 RepID=A0A1X7VHJ6_AMPQE|nr:PREDICTED: heat shock 70 kDa protein 12A-like [Amphimedon queenslandica]|eukprot:XP_011410276.1 PREDICTED: heat shock 70 kDa protein 12A-like [Amphimedon queenslandica]
MGNSYSTSTSSGRSTEVTYERLEKIPRTEAAYRVTNGNIAAIDFGTSSISLAYTTKGDANVSMISFESSKKQERSLNIILCKKVASENKIRVEALGDKAATLYQKLRKEEYSEYIYFERIKMLMRRDQKSITRDTPVESLSGEQYYLVEVIAFILKYMKDLLIDHLSRTVRPLKTTDFDWVITVPAIWDARGKRMMREAAYLASLLTESDGIVNFTPVSSSPLPLCSDVNPDKLSLALEPESAALYSQKNIASDINKDRSLSVINPPKKYMVIDIGGGTVDITAHAEDGDDIIVQNIPTGNACGGTQVNEAFSQLLQKLTKDAGYDRFLASNASLKPKRSANINMILYTDFEGQKCLFGQEEIEGIAIDLGKIAGFYDKELKEVQGMEGIEYECDSSTLYINKDFVESHLFGPVISDIKKCLNEAIADNGYEADAFYLVGGFGGCKYVYKKLKEVIENAYASQGRDQCPSVLTPIEPHLAVAQGAVLWRKNPEIIKLRKSDATYGIAIFVPFDKAQHDKHYKYLHEEERIYRCDSIFFPFLKRSETPDYNEVMVTSLIPHNQSDKEVCVKIFSTSEPDVQYVVDKNGQSTVREIGQLLLHVPNPQKLPKSQRKIDVIMDFSGTEIQAKAKYRVDESEVKTVCDFLSAQPWRLGQK